MGATGGDCLHTAIGSVIPSQRLRIEGVAAPLIVRRNARAKRISLRVDGGGEAVIVVLPHRARLQDGIEVARTNAGWIAKQLEALPARVPFVDGTALPVLGRMRTICHDPGARAGVREDGDVLRIGGPDGRVALHISAWLKRHARAAIAEAIGRKAVQLGRSPRRIMLRDTRSRWGSCSATGTLSFSWRLVLAPPEVLDYVVAHEMAHMLVHGHGPDFWRLAGDLADDLTTGRVWLKKHGYTLFRYG